MSKKVFFMHVPKTGGTSIYNLLKRNFKSVYITNLCDLPEVSCIDKYDLVSGHIPFLPLQEKFPMYDYEVVFFLRNPIHRFLSAFKHSRRLSEDEDSFGKRMSMMRNMKMVDFLGTRQGFMEMHTQLFLIAKAQGYSGQDVEKALESANQFLHRDCVNICITEEMDASVAFILDKFNLNIDLKMKSLNTSKQNPYHLSSEEIEESQAVLDELSKNEFILYNNALQLFQDKATSS